MYKLRELSRKDLNEINKWRNNSELIKFLGAPFRFIDIEVDIKWFDSYMSNRNNAVRCAVVNENDEILGLISLVDVDYINRSAVFNIMIGETNNQGKGIGSFATKEMLKHAFYNMNLHRIELTVLEDNARARRLYEKSGFKYEGTKRKCTYKNGEYVNMCTYSILEEEFFEK